jgi:hypothetical protein
MEGRRHRVSSAHAIALAALFVALGGTSYAVTQLPRDSVGGAQLQKNAVTSSKVKDGSLRGRDFGARDLARLKGPAGSPGAKGDPGIKGDTGATGATGPAYSFWSSDNPVFPDVDLSTSLADVASRAVTAPFAGQLIVNFSGNLYQSGAGAAQGECRVVLTQGATELASGQAGYEDFTADAEDHQLALTAGFTIPAAGSYTVRVRCAKTLVTLTPAVRLDRYDLTGILTGS